MFGGGGGLDPRKMEQMMKQMGIDVEELDAEEVVIRTADHDLVFTSPDVTKMDARGQETYQIIGSPEQRERADDETDADAASAIPDADVEIVADRTGASEEDARAALETNDGDLAGAVADLE
ncbi:nascent polypeptide-associated complex protein [Natronobiforma cellulositropha]|uniref:nascent polypeptide-associated complex protein n=1 Tax=Natronobiforma cellulositropha TaxID=1679076 RepID=UPI0021D57554|nr:nascent polypeptide-associated complex protein [Natronobiforma cellulositropha]